MEFSLTLGSVGEIIAVSQIILELRHSLGTSAESARQYKELRDELDSFVRILMQVIATYEQYEPSPWLDSVEKEIKLAIHDCAGVVRGALERFVPKYNQSLQPGGSGRMLRDVFKKVEWVFAEKKNLDKLHNKLRTYSDRIALLVAIAGRQSARVDNRTVLERIEKVSQLLANHEKTLTDMHEEQVRLCLDISNRLVMMERDSHTILPWVKMTYETVGEIKEMVGNVTRLVASMQSLASDSLLFRTLDPTREKPVLLEDPLGHIVEIPMDWIHDWSGFQALLEHRFQKLNGYQLVVERKYSLEDSCTGKDITFDAPWSSSFRRGMKVNMSMIISTTVFRSAPSPTNPACPRCLTEADVGNNASICCANKECGMWFRVIQQAAPNLAAQNGAADILGTRPTARMQEEIIRQFQRVRVMQSVTVRRFAGWWQCCNCSEGWWSVEGDLNCPTCRTPPCLDCLYTRRG